MKAKIRGTEIYFDVAGMQIAPEGNNFSEKPVLFLIHGGPGGRIQNNLTEVAFSVLKQYEETLNN